MTYERQVCNTLKEIRQQIADKNKIEYATSECHFEGECTGTCPKCDAELQYLENEIHKRKHFGKAATIAGIALGVSMTFSGCDNPLMGEQPIVEGDMMSIDTLYDRNDTCFSSGMPPMSKNTLQIEDDGNEI